MQTITTPAGIYTPPATALIQKVQLRIFESCPSATLCLMQYDRALPVISVELFEGGNPYKVPENAAVNIRMVKPDKTTVYNPALGVSSDRKTTYIGITPQMTACFGSCVATLEIALNDGVLGTGLLRLNIEKNPVSEDAVESSDEYLSLQEIVNKVQTYADQASTAADLAMNSVQAVVSVNAQNFTKEQKAQARANIGAASTMDTYGTVKYTEQKLTGEEKAQAVENIQAVSYRPGQNLGADGRTAARQNIGAVSKAQALTAVEEKYFYEMGEPLVPETTVNCDLANSSGIYYSSISNKGAAIIEMKPETVVVVVNGEQHKLTVQYSHNPDGTVNSAYIGNRSFLGTGYADNGEDYLFSYSATTGSVAVMYSRTSGEKTFSIHVAGNVLADEYLNPMVIKAKPQALTAAMMQQARENIGAVGAKEAIEAVEGKFFEVGLSPIYPEETVPCVATAFNGGTVYKGTLSANGADFYNANYEKVYVKIGGETVKCSVEYWMGNPGAKYAEIGNKHLRLSSAADTGEDFCIDYRLANGPSVIYTRAAGDVTFTVNTPVPVMKQEYLPPMGAADAVTYTAQELTDEQKAQARENIGAAAVGEGGGEVGDITWDDIGVTYSDTLTWDGNTAGLPNARGLFFKVSDAVPAVADVQKGGYLAAMGERMEIPADIPEEDLVIDGVISILEAAFVVYPEAVGVEMDGVIFPEAGIYFIKEGEVYIEELHLNGYNGYPVKEKIPETRLPLAEIGGVANWDAQEGEAGYVLNRPFGNIHETITPRVEVQFHGGSGGQATLLISRQPSVGGVYNVVWNGAEYKCVAVSVNESTVAFIGDGGTDSLPFEMAFGQVAGGVAAKDGSTTVTLEIYRDYVKKLDSAFLPERLGDTLHMEAALLDEGCAYPADSIGYAAAVIPAGATYIDLDAFAGLPFLQELTLNGNCEMETAAVLDRYGKTAYYYNALGNSGAPIRRLEIIGRATVDAHFARNIATLRELHLGAGVKTIGTNAFSYTGLDTVSMEEVTSVGQYAFAGNPRLKSIVICDGATELVYGAFFSCTSLESVTLPDTVTTMGNSCFGLCKNLASIVIPSSVTSIGSSAFEKTTVLKGRAGSYAESWAAENGYTFEVIA